MKYIKAIAGFISAIMLLGAIINHFHSCNGNNDTSVNSDISYEINKENKNSDELNNINADENNEKKSKSKKSNKHKKDDIEAILGPNERLVKIGDTEELPNCSVNVYDASIVYTYEYGQGSLYHEPKNGNCFIAVSFNIKNTSDQSFSLSTFESSAVLFYDEKYMYEGFIGDDIRYDVLEPLSTTDFTMLYEVPIEILNELKEKGTLLLVLKYDDSNVLVYDIKEVYHDLEDRDHM